MRQVGEPREQVSQVCFLAVGAHQILCSFRFAFVAVTAASKSYSFPRSFLSGHILPRTRVSFSLSLALYVCLPHYPCGYPTLTPPPPPPRATRRIAAGAVSKLDIHGAAGASSSPSALHACLSSERSSSAIVLATGSPASPGFTEVTFQDAAGGLLPSAAVSGGPEGDGEEAKGEKGGLAHVVGPGELGIRGSEKDSVVAAEAEGSAGSDDGDEEEEEEGDDPEQRWVSATAF